MSPTGNTQRPRRNVVGQRVGIHTSDRTCSQPEGGTRLKSTRDNLLTCAVDQDVQPSKGLHRGSHQLGRQGGVGHISRHTDGGAAAVANEVCCGLWNKDNWKGLNYVWHKVNY